MAASRKPTLKRLGTLTFAAALAALSQFFCAGSLRAQTPPAGTAAPSPPASRPAAPTPLASAPAKTPASNSAAEPAARIVTLSQALQAALEKHPSLLGARAGVRAAEARVDSALAPLLPQVVGTASYQRSTANVVPRQGQLAPTASSPTFTNYGFWNFGITATQTVYDFGQARGNYHVAEANAEVSRLGEQATRLNLALGVRNAYFQARQQKALVSVAVESLENLTRHLEQIQGFVEVGTRPPIDLVQAKADRQSGELTLLNAQNAYALARASLTQAMGLDPSSDFDVSDESLPAIGGEDGDPSHLYAQALSSRPDVQAAIGSVRAQQLAESAARGSYGPTLKVSTGITDAGDRLDGLRWNWNAQALLNWPIFEGGLTRARVAEARANADNASVQVTLLRQQVLLAVEQARVTIQGAKLALATADVLVETSRERLRLAEGRYQTGVGTILDLDDAELKLALAQSQRVQAEYNLATARAALMNAVGQVF